MWNRIKNIFFLPDFFGGKSVDFIFFQLCQNPSSNSNTQHACLCATCSHNLCEHRGTFITSQSKGMSQLSHSGLFVERFFFPFLDTLLQIKQSFHIYLCFIYIRLTAPRQPNQPSPLRSNERPGLARPSQRCCLTLTVLIYLCGFFFLCFCWKNKAVILSIYMFLYFYRCNRYIQ